MPTQVPSPAAGLVVDAQAMLAASPVAHVLLDVRHDVLWANDAAIALLGDGAGRAGADFAQVIGWPSTLDTEAPAFAEVPGRWLSCRSSELPDGRRLVAILDAQPLVDLRTTASRQTEQLDLAGGLGRLGTWWRDIQTLEGHWDPHMYRIWGLELNAATPCFEEAARAIVPQDRAGLTAAFEASLRQAGHYDHRYHIQRPDGMVRQLHSHWVVRNDTNGRPASVLGLVVDDTDSLALATAHAASQSELALAEEMTGLARWRYDLNTQKVTWSPNARAIIGAEPGPDGYTTEGVRALVHPDDLARVLASAEQTLRTGETTEYVARHRQPDGSWRDVLSRRSLVRDERGQPTGFIGVSMDVSARVVEQRKAEQLAARLELAASSAGVGMWNFEPGAERASWSAQMRLLHGVAADAPVPSTPEWIKRFVHPDDQALVRDGFRKLMAGEVEQVGAEIRIVRGDGTVRTLMTHARADAGTEPRAMFGIVIDVTERRRADLALRRASERATLAARGAGLGTWERDLRDDSYHWDEQMWRLRGREPQPVAPDVAQILAMIHPDDRDAAREQITASNRGEQIVHLEFRVIWPDGQVRWLATRSGPVRDDDGRTVRRIGVNWDITDARRAESERRDRELAQQASEAKSQFLSRMSHELRTPLNAMLGFTQLQLARHPGNDPTGQSHLQHVLDAGQHLLALINDVLDLTQLEQGRMVVACEPIDLSALLRETVALIEPQRRALNHSELVLGSLDATPSADPIRLRQVLINLLSNAVKYDRPGGTVRIDAQDLGEQVSIRVADTGPGLSAEQLSHLFEPFNRLGNESGPIEGTGIGLVIARALVERMGGTLQVDSQPGVGSVFTVSLPTANRAQPEQPELTPHRPTPVKALPDTKAMGQVLYIEDNPVNAMLLTEMLKHATELTLHHADSGAKGLSLAQQLQPDLILVDMHLPDFDGFEVFRRLQADSRTANLRCVALSANALPRDIERARAAGFVDYWTKPVDLRHLLAALDDLLGQGTTRPAGRDD